MAPRFRHRGRVTADGPLIRVRIGHGESVRRALSGTGLADPTIEVPALIDTGAMGTYLDGTVIDAIGLRAARAAFEVQTAVGAPHLWDAYEVRVIFGEGYELNVFGARLDEYALPGTRCILGRDILRRRHLAYSGRTNSYVLELD